MKILERSSEHWWWAESEGRQGYVPANHLTYGSFQQMCWQDDEYFGSYGKLVRDFLFVLLHSGITSQGNSCLIRLSAQLLAMKTTLHD